MDICRGRKPLMRRHCCVARDVLVRVDDSGRVSDAEHRWNARRILVCWEKVHVYYNLRYRTPPVL